MSFDASFKSLTGNSPFPWQEALYERFASDRPDNIPSSCNLPTGLGKTSVVAIWLIALAQHPDRVPRRLVYVVNRRTVVDQTTTEVEKYRSKLLTDPALDTVREQLAELCALKLTDGKSKQNIDAVSPLAVSTLRGQFADNRKWSADPARPAVIVGTVDMIGSRLLFSGYGVGFKSKPLHAGFLAQDSLLIHDEAHLEPAFQSLLIEIAAEQNRCREFRRFRVMELSATSRQANETFSLTEADRANSEVSKRVDAQKAISLHQVTDEKKLVDKIVEFAKTETMKDRAVLIFVRMVDDVEKIVKQLPKGATQQLTGTLRGFERDRMADPTKDGACEIFARFLKPDGTEAKWTVKPRMGTVYLVCTSAGEVGVNISADHLVCDLTTFDSMAQRFGRVNRFGNCNDSEIHVVHPKEFDLTDEFDQRRARTLDLLVALNGNGSPKALGDLALEERLAAFAPTPTILPATDILFDAWALTTIRDKLPGRPPVEPYLHGISSWEPPETHVAWRSEVDLIVGELINQYHSRDLEDLLEDYPIKPHEMLRDNSSRVFERLKKLRTESDKPVWLVSADGSVEVTTLNDLVEAGKENLSFKTVLLPPSAGGLERGLLTPSASAVAEDVADELFTDNRQQRRIRLRGTDSRLEDVQKRMRLIRIVDITQRNGAMDEDSSEQQLWYWYELPNDGDSDGSKTNKLPVAWQDHTDDVTSNVAQIVEKLQLSNELKTALILAARFHDLGKQRTLWQRSIGNPNPTNWWAKSGGNFKPRDLGDGYRHEFGSLANVLSATQPHFSELEKLEEMQDVVLHLIATHHGFARPHFPADFIFDPEPNGADLEQIAAEIPRRFARLQHKYGRWGLAYLESLLRAADYAASANPKKFAEGVK